MSASFPVSSSKGESGASGGLALRTYLLQQHLLLMNAFDELGRQEVRNPESNLLGSKSMTSPTL